MLSREDAIKLYFIASVFTLLVSIYEVTQTHTVCGPSFEYDRYF